VNHFDVIIIGGGLAGLTAALHLSKLNYSILLIEKQAYPHHKVCGEYVSNEIIPYLNSLNVYPKKIGAIAINQFQLSTVKGKSTTTSLPLGGIGISRYTLDHLLYRHAKKEGSRFIFDTVTKIAFNDDIFKIYTAKNQLFTSKLVIGAYGKRSNLDKQLNRDFINKKSYWMGVKAHYHYNNFPDNLVALHNFNGGYGGLSKTESGAINFCYLTSYKSFQSHSNIEEFNTCVVAENPFLKNFLRNATPLFKKPLTIAQVSFHKKSPVDNHMLMCGDTAGLIHPLCGNGMAMAIHSAKIASELIHNFYSGNIKNRDALETTYTDTWNATFKQRLWMGRKLQSLLISPRLSNYAMTLAGNTPFLLKKLISLTHGKPVRC
jgi:flavin-dependent dehydrogenase